MKKVTVLGAGMVGAAIARDLSTSFEVTSIDRDRTALRQLNDREPSIHCVEADLQDYTAYPSLLAAADFVVTAVPGFMGFRTLENVIMVGKNAVDISFFPENALDLQPLARQKEVTVITDCGVAPGLGNWILGYHAARMRVDRFRCYVGGLPLHPQAPFYYKAPFSPVDVLEEYSRPARQKEKGNVIAKPALSDREILHFEPVGKLEAFNTDGLRSLLITMPQIPDMTEKTLRYPGHVDQILLLQEAGFLSPEPVVVKNNTVIPLELSTALLLKQWKLEPDEPEFTLLKVIINGEDRQIEYDLYDEYDPGTHTSSMARTTGYTCTAALHLLANGLFTEKGIFPPELPGADEQCFRFVLNYLRDRGIQLAVRDHATQANE